MERKAFYEIEKPPKTTEIILVPMEVPTEPDHPDILDNWSCMYVFKRTLKRIFVCGESAEASCICCDARMCGLHWSNKTLYVYDQEGQGDMALCQSCAKLPREHIERIRALRLELNR